MFWERSPGRLTAWTGSVVLQTLCMKVFTLALARLSHAGHPSSQERLSKLDIAREGWKYGNRFSQSDCWSPESWKQRDLCLISSSVKWLARMCLNLIPEMKTFGKPCLKWSYGLKWPLCVCNLFRSFPSFELRQGKKKVKWETEVWWWSEGCGKTRSVRRDCNFIGLPGVKGQIRQAYTHKNSSIHGVSF